MDKNLLKYRAFVEAVEKGSFTKTAESLDYAQSSISKMVGDLEKEWGIILLKRNKHGVCLTTAGEQLMPLVKKKLDDFGKLKEEVDQIHGIQSGTVRIGRNYPRQHKNLWNT